MNRSLSSFISHYSIEIILLIAITVLMGRLRHVFTLIILIGLLILIYKRKKNLIAELDQQSLSEQQQNTVKNDLTLAKYRFNIYIMPKALALLLIYILPTIISNNYDYSSICEYTKNHIPFECINRYRAYFNYISEILAASILIGIVAKENFHIKKLKSFSLPDSYIKLTVANSFLIKIEYLYLISIGIFLVVRIYIEGYWRLY